MRPSPSATVAPNFIEREHAAVITVVRQAGSSSPRAAVDTGRERERSGTEQNATKIGAGRTRLRGSWAATTVPCPPAYCSMSLGEWGNGEWGSRDEASKLKQIGRVGEDFLSLTAP